jgi:hypothetical protein
MTHSPIVVTRFGWEFAVAGRNAKAWSAFLRAFIQPIEMRTTASMMSCKEAKFGKRGGLQTTGDRHALEPEEDEASTHVFTERECVR